MAQGDLYDAANEILATCIAALNWTERAYVSNGPPAYDCCPQLTVHATGFNRDMAPAAQPAATFGAPSISAAKRTRRGSMNAAGFAVTVLECAPTITGKTKIVFPEPDAIDLSSEKMMGDAWLLWNYLQSRLRDESLFGGACRPVDIGPAVPLTDQGGCGGWVIQMSVQIDGYTAAA